jgi:cell division protein ZapA
MPVVRLNFGQNVFPLACGEGEEKRLQELAARVNRRMEAVRQEVGKGSDMQLLAIASLMMEEEIDQLKKADQKPSADAEIARAQKDLEQGWAEAMDSLAEYVEKMAEKIESNA